MGAHKLDPWTLEMLMAIAMRDIERKQIAIAMGAKLDVFVTPGFLERLRDIQELWLDQSLHEAGCMLREFRRLCKK